MATQTERMKEALLRIAQWSEAYPFTTFPEVDRDYALRARQALTSAGLSLDRLSADAIRHVVQAVGEIARKAVADVPSD